MTRKPKRIETILEKLPLLQAHGQAGDIDAAMEARAIEDALSSAAITPLERKIVTLISVYGYSHIEVARMLKMSRQTVTSMNARAVDKVAAKYGGRRK